MPLADPSLCTVSWSSGVFNIKITQFKNTICGPLAGKGYTVPWLNVGFILSYHVIICLDCKTISFHSFILFLSLFMLWIQKKRFRYRVVSSHIESDVTDCMFVYLLRSVLLSVPLIARLTHRLCCCSSFDLPHTSCWCSCSADTHTCFTNKQFGTNYREKKNQIKNKTRLLFSPLSSCFHVQEILTYAPSSAGVY